MTDTTSGGTDTTVPPAPATTGPATTPHPAPGAHPRSRSHPRNGTGTGTGTEFSGGTGATVGIHPGSGTGGSGTTDGGHSGGTPGRLRLGVFVPTVEAPWEHGLDPHGVVEFGVRAERLGFDSLWVTDSLLTPRIEAMTALTALAMVTERVVLGTGALLPALRTPVQAAHTIASVDRLSDGRLVLGVGAGFPGRFGRPVYEMAGTPWPRRFTRLDETVDLWRRLWSAQGPVTFEGEVLRFEDVPAPLRPTRPEGPPIWLGGATPKALDRAGRLYDGWLPYPPDPADYATGLTAIRAAADGAGRSEQPFSPALFVNVLVSDATDGGRALLDDYAHRAYGMPISSLEQIQAVVAGPADVVAEHLAAYVRAGARDLVIRCAAPDVVEQRAQVEALAELRPLLEARAGVEAAA
ncbi:LLM class flavin-dependent oxidoreductase [Actinacidiphila yeochonensis]|uniref:LLM class flavin-dependent oxidoreductase n=1 Tax=Actinacidiphila yeochonensis TaxID=89050 RepID=UPI001E64B2C5|nr:LLM class flavin-dependent oxidoreductase [Actinacidiphila yeochonensis]